VVSPEDAWLIYYTPEGKAEQYKKTTPGYFPNKVI
jgi:hypothetical protein